MNKETENPPIITLEWLIPQGTAWHNLYINNNGDVGPRTPKLPEANTESIAIGATAMFLIWGFNLTTKEYVATTMFEASQNLKVDKKDNLYHNIFRLLKHNSASREWIKKNNLDGKSRVDWDEVVPYIGLFPYSQKQKLPVEFRENLNPYTPKALEQFILHVIDYINGLPTAKPDKKRFDILPDFRLGLQELKPENRSLINPALLNQVESLLEKRR